MIKYFHASPSKNRKSIEKLGLIFKNPSFPLLHDKGLIFFDKSFINPIDFQLYMGEDNDIWELTKPQIYEWEVDPNWFGGVFTRNEIDSNNLKLSLKNKTCKTIK